MRIMFVGNIVGTRFSFIALVRLLICASSAYSISFYYEFSKEQDYICTTAEDSGMHSCTNFPPYRYGALACNGSAVPFNSNAPTNTSCVNWNQYYTNCTQRGSNPFQGTISFDNIGLAWVAIFLVSIDNTRGE
jgi:voltage-dependent calcium channel T type alpha-1G